MDKWQREEIANMMAIIWNVAESEKNQVQKTLLEAAGNLLEASLENVDLTNLDSRIDRAIQEAKESSD